MIQYPGMNQNFTEEQIQAMIEKIKKINPTWANRERAIRLLKLIPEISGDISAALKALVKESEKKPSN